MRPCKCRGALLIAILIISFFGKFFLGIHPVHSEERTTRGVLIFDPDLGLFFSPSSIGSEVPQSQASQELIGQQSESMYYPLHNNRSQQKEDENVDTGISSLIGSGTRYPNWIIDSMPDGARIIGLSVRQIVRTPQEIHNMPVSELSRLVVRLINGKECALSKLPKEEVIQYGMRYYRVTCK